MEFKDFDIADVGTGILLVGGVWADEHKMYLFVLPEFDEHAEDQIRVLCPSAEEWKALLRQSDLVEKEVLEKAADGKLVKAVARKCQRNIDQNVSWAVYRRDEFRCRYCGNGKVPLTVDHLVLWEEGGPSTEENLVAACRKCNKTRGNMQYADWLKHPYYRKRSQNLTSLVRADNEALVGALDAIPRVIKKRKR